MVTKAETSTMNTLVTTYARVTEQIKLLEETQKNLKSQIIQGFEDFNGHGSAIYCGSDVKIRRVIQNRTSYDADAMVKLVSRRTWQKITTRQIDAELFKAAVMLGTIKLADVESAIKVTEVDALRIV